MPTLEIKLDVDSLSDYFADLELEAEAWWEDCSFDHAFGTEKVIDFRTEGITKVERLIYKKGKFEKRVDISKMTILELMNEIVSDDEIVKELEDYDNL